MIIIIDIENQVYNIVRNCVITDYPDIMVYGEYVRTPTIFPCIMVSEIDNSTYKKSLDNTNIENHSDILYQIDIYCNGDNKKNICKSISKLINGELFSYGFVRIFNQPTSNIEDTNIYRITLRYHGIVGKDNLIYKE